MATGDKTVFRSISETGAFTGELNISARCQADTFNATSDRNKKTDIKDIVRPMNILKEFRGVTYKWIDKEKDQTQQAGVIAQEVERVFPEAVFTDEGNNKTVNYNAIVGLLVSTVNDQQKQIDSLKKTISHFSQTL